MCMDEILEEDSDQYYELLALKSIYESDEDVLKLYTVKENEQCLNAGTANVSIDLPNNTFKIELHNNKDPYLTNITGELANEASEYHVQCLPPIVINFVLKKEYPISEPPSFNLSCKWLSRKQLTILCHELDRIWENQKGSEVLYDWLQFLQSNTLSTLGLNEIKLLPDKQGSPTDADCRAVQPVMCFAEILPFMLEYNEITQQKKFDKSVFSCKICFCEKYGKDCIQFKGCEHVYCNECLLPYFSLHIKEGTVTSLLCPEDKCESQAFPAQIKGLVTEEEFVKYERLLLQTTLDVMTDIVYCPRKHCQSPVIVEPKETMGYCNACQYAFCTYCKFAYHEELAKVCDDFLHGDEAQKVFLQKRYGAKAIEHKLQEMESEKWIHENSKACPNCNAPVEKQDGCNKMTCTKCRAYFCWLCLNNLSIHNPYSHYNTYGKGCYQKLFFEMENEDDFEILFF